MALPSDRVLPRGPVRVVAIDSDQLDEIHEWIHDRWYDPSEVAFDSDSGTLEVPFNCTVYDEMRDKRGIPFVVGWWKVPVVRGVFRLREVRDCAVRDDGNGMFSELRVSSSGAFRINGISEINGQVTSFEASVEVDDQIIGWVSMNWILLMQSEGSMRPIPGTSAQQQME